MAVHVDPYDGAIVIDGFEAGIANDPFRGIADLRNVNITSIPGEASVGFSTSQISAASFGTISVTSASAANDTITYTGATSLESYQAITFSASTIGGISTGTPYWVGTVSGGGTTATLYSDYEKTSLVNITLSGTGTFSTFNVNRPKYFTRNPNNAGTNWMLDALGQVWSDVHVTTTNSYWTYTGNLVPLAIYTAGNGIGYYQNSDGVGYIFVFHNSSIDYTAATAGSIGWIYQWNPALGAGAGYNASPTPKLNTNVLKNNSHETLVGQDNVLYYCDGSYLGSLFETPGQIFDPTGTMTYTYAKKALSLPSLDIAQCLAELGINLLVGGQRNQIYPWNRISTSFTYPILLAENSIVKMVTVNTNTYIFVGNRGRIYVTNGSQAGLFKKVPDHISGTVDPYYSWGGATFTKNQLYFGISATTNGGTAIVQYGGLWGIDLDTKAIRLTNKLSYGTYAGYASALLALPVNQVNLANPVGLGMIVGWDNGSSGYGLDKTAGTPYTNLEATVDSDLIPVGTYQKPRNFSQIEYRLTKPMVTGESITLNYRLDFSQSYATIMVDNAAGNFSSTGPVNFSNAQWLQIQAVLNSTASSPSYTRLKEIRITRASE